MVKRRFVAAFVVVLALWLPAGRCLADGGALLEQAEQYREDGNYAEAETIYKAIVAADANTDEAFTAQEGLTVLYIYWERQEDANTAYHELLARYSERTGIAKAVDHVADAYREKEHYTKAKTLYQYVVDHWPEAEHALRSQETIAILSIQLGDDQGAQAAIDKLVTTFSGHKDVAEAVDEVADKYRELGNYTKAIETYRRIVTTWPSAEHTIRSQVGIVHTQLLRQDETAADAAIEELVVKFSDTNQVAEAFNTIADICRELDKSDKARALWQRVLQDWPAAPHAMWSQMTLAKSDITRGNFSTSQAGINNLLNNFANHPELPAALYELAEKYKNLERLEEAKSLYQQIVQRFPESEQATKALVDVSGVDIFLLIEAGDQTAVDEAIDQLVASFVDEPQLLQEVFLIGERYLNKALTLQAEGKQNQSSAYFLKAIETYEKLINELPSSEIVPEACMAAAKCYHQLGDYEMSVQYYQKVADYYPDYPFVWHALAKAASGYGDLAKAGLMEKSEAQAKTKAAYEKLVTDYPDCKAANIARQWLSCHP